jgi:hypothetical protein
LNEFSQVILQEFTNTYLKAMAFEKQDKKTSIDIAIDEQFLLCKDLEFRIGVFNNVHPCPKIPVEYIALYNELLRKREKEESKLDDLIIERQRSYTEGHYSSNEGLAPTSANKEDIPGGYLNARSPNSVETVVTSNKRKIDSMTNMNSKKIKTSFDETKEVPAVETVVDEDDNSLSESSHTDPDAEPCVWDLERDPTPTPASSPSELHISSDSQEASAIETPLPLSKCKPTRSNSACVNRKRSSCTVKAAESKTTSTRSSSARQATLTSKTAK